MASGLSPDWVWSNTSNATACNDREWFDEYEPFESHTGTHFGPGPRVLGVGTVNLPVITSPDATGPKRHGILKLTNVIHVPDAVCNIISSHDFIESMPDGCGFTLGMGAPGTQGSVLGPDGESIAYFKGDHRLFALALSEPPVGPVTGPSRFRDDTHYAVNVEWPDSEFARFQAHMAQRRQDPTKQRYSAEEKQWLKTHFGGEYHFLRVYGLSIYKEEDRDEGAAIVRGMMANE
ncbi:hypothetical protein CkaCkLH20_10618 [Colletotrichum karsti]|uniref:Retrovirus-related Pol polyprotein from transposon TNT 1-94-like beta-barrel domain-containing protein n=1 Tax=Colletotrichum karsti TaxID=1095194 RepID=A0A9P6I0X7_9PEZI|nr:uncharacterized protein CkaCkLH20_10618 [Colletotrichum karsti]KAF9871986.1 hypothetical protein CkaCkLH20_10618 [Colletotrichum karsti]